MTLRRPLVVLALALSLGLACTNAAFAAGGNYTIVGGTTRNATQIRRALNASRFDWSLVQAPITIHVAAGGESSSTPGHIWLSPELLASGLFSWGVVQHEYAHQVDFFLLDERDVRLLGLRGFDRARGIPDRRRELEALLRLDERLDRVTDRRVVLGDEHADRSLVAQFASSFEGMLASTFTDPDVAPTLTHRDREVLRLLASGERYEEIGRTLFVSTATVRKAMSKIKTELGAASATEAVAAALRHSLIA